MAAKFFVLVISQNFCNIFKFESCENFLEFNEIQNYIWETQNFDKIIFKLAKFQENFAKHEFKNFAKIS